MRGGNPVRVYNDCWSGLLGVAEDFKSAPPGSSPGIPPRIQRNMCARSADQLQKSSRGASSSAGPATVADKPPGTPGTRSRKKPKFEPVTPRSKPRGVFRSPRPLYPTVPIQPGLIALPSEDPPDEAEIIAPRAPQPKVMPLSCGCCGTRGPILLWYSYLTHRAMVECQECQTRREVDWADLPQEQIRPERSEDERS